VVLAEGAEKRITKDVLKSFCTGKLAIHKVPKHIEFTDSLNVSSTGKKVKRI